MNEMNVDIHQSNSGGAKSRILKVFLVVKERLLGSPISASKLYNLGYVVLFGGVGVELGLNLFLPGQNTGFFLASTLGAILIWTIAFSLEAAARTLALAKNRFFLFGLALLSIPITQFSSIWISRFVNDTTGVDPSELPDAISSLLVIFVPLTWIYAAFAILAILAFAMMTVGLLWSAVAHTQAQGRAFFARLLVTIFIVTYGFIFADFLGANSLRFAKGVIVAAEYFKDDRCINLNTNEIIAHLKDGASVFNVETKEFSLTECQLRGAN
ncbi:MAG: hypothetical protein ACRBBM_08935 [Pseudomonadaceae bacterium]